MNKKLLLSAPLGCPGAVTALRNHQAVLKPNVRCDFIPLEHLIFPHLKAATTARRIYYGLSRRLKVISIKRILPYGENIIFGSFSPTYEVVVNKLNKRGIRPSFIWHSSIGQLEQTPGERELFMRVATLLEEGRIKHLLLHRRLYHSIGVFVKRATFFPHSIDLSQFRGVVKKDIPGINCDLFCRVRFGKNVLNQILAFQMAGSDGNLHINFDPQLFRGIIETIGVNVVRHKWLPVADYYGLVAAMDLSLQVTIGESFNYAVCERMALGVPVLTTEDIYLISEDSVLRKYLCVKAVDTPSEIAGGIKLIVNDRKLAADLGLRCKSRIADVAKTNNAIVINQIGSHFTD